MAVLSGAGISTESGLRDYRSPGSKRTRPPISHQEYASSAYVRKRYWARSFVGYSLFSRTVPNRTHHALARLHRHAPAMFPFHITQNVDGLLQKAADGFPINLIELHGTVHVVTCTVCACEENRAAFQDRLHRYNLRWAGSLKDYEFRPDGDAELDEYLVSSFQVPKCYKCGKDALMPKVVFHGGSVPRPLTLDARRIVDNSNAVLVVGSTLTTYSAFSLVKRARDKGAVLACCNFGPTRADNLYDLKIETALGDTVTRLANHLLAVEDNATRLNTVV